MSRLSTWVVGGSLLALTLGALVVQAIGLLDNVWVTLGTILVQIVFAVAAALMWMDRGTRPNGILLALAEIVLGLQGFYSDVYERAGGYSHEIGWLLLNLHVPLVLTVLLRYPTPMPRFRGRRLLLAGAWVYALLPIPASLLWSPARGGYHGPAQWLTLYPANAVCERILDTGALLIIGLAVWISLLQVRRWKSATGRARSSIRLISAATIVLAVTLAVRVMAGYAVGWRWIGGSVSDVLSVAQSAAAFVAATALLVIAIGQAVHRSDVVERLLTAAGDPKAVQETLRRELADPSLTVSFRLEDVWLDADGSLARDTIDSTPGRVVRGLAERDGQPTVRVVAAESVGSDPVRLRITLAAAELVLDNTRLTVERTAHLAELAAAQARIVEAGVAQRRQLERDLHDGAQQSLLGVVATLSRAGLTDDPATMRAAVDDARGQLSAAVAELRQLARGIHPAALTQGGLRAGLTSLAARTDRVVLTFGPGFAALDRLPAAIESTAYFVAAEAVTNALKYGGLGPITVDVDCSDRTLVVAVADDGPGSARLVPGGGLAGLLDRVRALGGDLQLHARPGGGVQVEARLPFGDAAS